MLFRLSAGAVAVAAAVACAPVSKLPEISEEAAKREREIQRELAFQRYYENTRRVHVIAYPVLKASIELCGDNVRPGSGVLAVTKYFFKEDYRTAAGKVADIQDRVRVVAIAAGSAGAGAGFREGDLLVSLNGWQIPSGKDAMVRLGERFLEFAKDKADMVVVVQRGEKPETLAFRPDTICKYGYRATEGANVNAFADGQGIFMEAGMMSFARHDDDLATVIGHEIAHNVMGHITKSQTNVVIGSLVDILFAGFGVNTQGTFGRIGGAAFSQEFEAEADYVGLYLTARAGFKIDDAPTFWRRMAVQFPGSIKSHHAASHPATPERFLALEKTVAEIKAKQAAGKPLLPEKQDPAATPAAPVSPPQ